jgi:ribosomal protein S27AE
MSDKIYCPKCSKNNFWKTKDNRLKCKNCLYIFTLKSNLLNIPKNILDEIISEFVLEHSTNVILERVNVSKYKLLKTLIFLRMLMVQDVYNDFQGIIKITSESFEISHKIRNPIIVIFYKKEKVFAKVLTNIKPEELKDFIKNQDVNYSEKWQKNIGLVYKNHLYKNPIKNLENRKYHLDLVEAFWGYLKKKLAAKGGVRKEKFPLFLGEYVWRYNNRKLTLKEQEEKLKKLTQQNFSK